MVFEVRSDGPSWSSLAVWPTLFCITGDFYLEAGSGAQV